MLKSILSTATFRQSQITIVGTIINGFLGALFYIFMARFLGPSDFGLLTVAIVTLTLIADIVDFGTNTGLVKFVSGSLGVNANKAFKFLKLSFEIKFVVWLVVLLIGFFASPLIAEKIFNKLELVLPLRLVMVGVGGALFFSFAVSSLQAFQKYFSWSFINISTNFLRLIFIFILLFYQQLNITTGLLAYILLPFFGFTLALLFLPAGKILSVKEEFSVANQFFKYNFWVAAFTIVAALSSRLDTFLSARLLSVEDVGIYGAANQLVQVIPQIVGALGVVAAPKFAGFQSLNQMLTYFKKFQLLVSGLCLAGILSIPLLVYLIPVIYGQEYQGVVIPFIFLFLAMLIFLFSVPIHNSIIFYYGRPDVFIWVSVGHLIIIGGLGYFMISNYGVTGASITVLIGTIFNFIYPLVWLLIKLKR